MATTAGQNLSLGKLRRACDGNNSYTAQSRLGQDCGGTTTASSNVKMSDFSITAVGSLSGFAYLWELTTETYALAFTNSGSRFGARIGTRADNFSWDSTGTLNVSFTGSHQNATVTAGGISNANTGTGADDDYYAAGAHNQSGSLTVKFHEDGQSDGYNDHATNYNTDRTKSITIVDAYGGSPSCLLEGTPIDMADGTTKNVEDLRVGDWVVAMNRPGQIDEDEDNWRSSRFPDEQTETFTQHSASVQDINFDFAYNYWDINNGAEKITGEHEMLYKPSGENTWMWQLVPGMKVGAHLMDKDGNEVEITSLQNVIDNDDGFEVVQIDVEPLDVYFGKSFLVHNKGSNDNPFD